MTNLMNHHYKSVRHSGLTGKPRGLDVTQVLDMPLTFIPGSVYTRPGGSSSIGFVELLQFIAGTFNIETFKKVAPNARLDLFTGQSAYGPRVVGQFERVIRELTFDPYSRRAVVMIAHPTDTSETLPCTLSMQFQINNTTLISIVTMRSSDLIWGLPTDLIQFGGIHIMIANCLGVRPGLCSVNAGNAHVYSATALKDGEEFSLKGRFELPKYFEYEAYAEWAKIKLDQITSGEKTVSSIFPILPTKVG